MPQTLRRFLHSSLSKSRSTLRWTVLAIAAGILAGSASALLIVLLNWASATRESHHDIIAFLPLAGLGVGLMYHYLGRSVEAGNNLILEEIHSEAAHPSHVIPARMTPLILFGTTLTHLFGGSAGREGTAVQTGASLTDQIVFILRRLPHSRFTHLTHADRRILLMAGISAGFGSVFGTPLAGAVFGLEVLTVGMVSYQALFPCFIASFAADLVTRAWGAHHTAYIVAPEVVRSLHLTSSTLSLAALAGIVFGVTAYLFAHSTHLLTRLYRHAIPYAPLRPLCGGAIVALLAFSLHAYPYIGLGIPTIVAAFSQPLPHYAFAAKFGLTVLTLSAGFKGGEVTPLFFIGATLGNALSSLLPLPSPLLAAMGFVAVFAGAANTPIASSLMAIELFGPEVGSLAAVACVTSYLFSGQKGIYHAQRRHLHKHHTSPETILEPIPEPTPEPFPTPVPEIPTTLS